MEEVRSSVAVIGRKIRKAIVKVLFLAALGCGLWTWGSLKYVYARGERAGFIQKISQKGWLCKTWEGELAMANLPGTMPQIFTFSVRDEAVAKEIMSHAGARVSLSYDQHRGIPTTCFGETQYFVTNVVPVASQ